MDKLVRPSSKLKARFFPPILYTLYNFSNSFYAGKNSPELDSVPQKDFPINTILQLVNRPFTWWQLWTGRGLDEKGQLARILWLHRNILNDELNGHWIRADFLWREIIRAIKYVQEQVDYWERLDNQLAKNNRYQVDVNHDLCNCVIKELLIDTNCALLYGRLEQSNTCEPDDRTLTYINNIQALLSLTKLEEPERWLVIEPLVYIVITSYRKRSQFQQASSFCRIMMYEFPNRWKYQDILVELEVQSVLARLQNKEDISSNQTDVDLLQGSIRVLTELSRVYPNNPVIYDSLGFVHQLHAIKLAKTGKLASALLAIEESLVYSPKLTEAMEIREQLRSALQTLQEQFKELDQKLSANPELILNPEGERLRSLVQEGSKSADQFIESGQAATIINLSHRAHAIRLWQDAGLDGDNEKIADSAVKFFDALVYELDDLPDSFEAINEKLIEITNDIPEIDEEKCKLLATYLFNQFSHSDTQSEATLTTDCSVLLPQHMTEIASSEPIGMWLFSKEALGIKFITVISLVLVLVSFTSLAWDQYKTNLRNYAYAEIIDAVRSGDKQGVSQAVKQFIASEGLKPDSRHNQVLNFQELPNLWTRNAAYKELVTAMNSGNFELIMDAAETFFSAPSFQAEDRRQEEVMNAYNKAFVTWFIALTNPDDLLAQNRINTYKSVTENIRNGGSKL